MHTLIRTTTLFVVALLPAAAALGQDPKALEVLTRADAATRTVKACTYHAEFYAEGEYAKRVPRIEGSFVGRGSRTGFVRKLFGHDEAKLPSMRAKYTVFPLSGEKNKKEMDVATDGKCVTLTDLGEKYWMTQDIAGGEVLLDGARQLYMLEFFHPTPFSDELNGRSQTYEGTKEVGGVVCDVVYVKYQMQGLEARWYFGQEDHLPRRVDRIYLSGRFTGVRTLSISNLNVRPTIAACEFRPNCPPDCEKRRLDRGWDSSLLPRGAEAPDWKLDTVDGKTISLSDLRGKVVVIDFWSTWCVFCKAAMPETQKLHEHYKDKPVQIVGICCWDPKGKPDEYMKKMNFTFDSCVKGDKVAEKYLVSGLPTYYVIDQEGKIVFAGAGAAQTKGVMKAVDKALKGAK